MSLSCTPSGWFETSLGEIIELKYGKSLPAKVRSGEGCKVYGSNGVVGKHSEPLVLGPGIIVGRKGSFGEVHLSDTPFFPIDTTYFVDQLWEQPIKYWYYQLKNLPLTQLNRSSAIPGLNREDAYAQEIALPPLAEQKQIAAKLDEVLAQVDTLKTRLDAIPAILKRFRQSVLAAAVSGRLTEEWRKLNKENTSLPQKGQEKCKVELFDLAKQSLPELPDNWLIVPAAYLLSYVTSGSRGWSKYYSESGSLFLRMSNVRYDTTKIDLKDLQFVALPESIEGKRSLVKIDDLLISITADVGRVARIDRDLSEAYVNQHLALARPTTEVVSEYFAICIAARNIGIKQIDALKRGATKVGLGLDDIRSLAIPFPPFKEQTEIVRCVERIFGFADQIEQRVKDTQSRVNHITQSILAKAFRGELTAEWRKQNQELINGENSAEALLEKIKSERTAATKHNTPARRTTKRKSNKSMKSKQIISVVEALKTAKKPLTSQQLLSFIIFTAVKVP